MSDISKLEQRIKSLEYYTSLNQLEVNYTESVHSRREWTEQI